MKVKDLNAPHASDLGRSDGETQLLGIIAKPIGHSKSPAIHNLAFRLLNLNYVYLAFEVGQDQLEDVLNGVSRF